MKNKLLLPLLLLPLLFAGCQLNNDVDFPEPQKPVSEILQGKWHNASNDDTYYFDDGAIMSDNKGLFFVPTTAEREEQEETYEEATDFGDYTLTESGGKTYIELIDYSNGYSGTHTNYLISTTSDTTMVWEKQDGTGPNRLVLSKQTYNDAANKPVDELLNGDWYLIYTIPDHYPTIPFMFPDTYSFANGEDFYIYNEAYGDGAELHYSITQRDGKTYIDHYELYPPEGSAGGPYTFEIMAISAEKMTLKLPRKDDDLILEFIRK
ncbi:hypothetical protein [Pontibacter chitinilyticus]|uniref:hypothetical protein n=1 Tax=Pontibacter chitinilyticus TaxID=2674989 RepID=UPI00321B90DA